MSTTTSFDLAQLIRDMGAIYSDDDPRVVASAVAGAIPGEAIPEVLSSLLVAAVREQWRIDRTRAHAAANAARSNNTNSRWADASAAYRALLTSKEYVPTEGKWKQLADCTRDDIIAIAADRDRLAQSNAVMRDKFARLAQAMSGGQVVADLPEDVLLEALR